MKYIIVFLLGVFVGMLLTCLCVASKNREESERIRNEETAGN